MESSPASRENAFAFLSAGGAGQTATGGTAAYRDNKPKNRLSELKLGLDWKHDTCKQAARDAVVVALRTIILKFRTRKKDKHTT